jgi:uncharacterized membrane protein
MSATARRTSSRQAAGATRDRLAPSPSRQPRGGAGKTAAASTAVPRWLAPAATAVSILGLGMSTYLTITHYAASAVPLACPATGGINCEKVTTSPQSMIFGIPVAVYGAAFFVAMVAANLPPAWRSSRWWVGLGRLALAVAGIGFVVYLIYAELFLINAICLECTSVHVLTFVLFVLVVAGTAHQGVAGWRATEADRP